MTQTRCAIATVAIGRAAGHLDHTFTSFAVNANVPLHAFILGENLPERQLPGITYHLIRPIPDFSHPLREIYFRRMELIDELHADLVLVVDCYDVLCMQPLPPLTALLGTSDVAACTEHGGAYGLDGQGYTANFLNGGVVLWNVPRSRDIRQEITARGRARFRTVQDDQFCLNEVIHTRHFDRLRILPCQYNYRPHLDHRDRNWPTVGHLDGVMIYHNAYCIENARKLMPVKPRADLEPLRADGRPLTPREQFLRRLQSRFCSATRRLK